MHYLRCMVREREDYFRLVPVTPHWRNFFEDGTTIDLADTLEGMKALDNITEKDFEELQAFYSYTEKLYDFTNEILFKNQAETIFQTLKYYPPFKILKDSDYFRTMDEGIRKYITNPYLIDIMNYFIKYVGSNPYDAPAVMNLSTLYSMEIWFMVC